MADTLRVIVDEIRTSINQYFDDKIISRAQVAYWVIIVGNTLKGQHISKRSSGQFLSVHPDVPVKVADDNDTKNVIKGRKYIELPGAIFDFDKDRGVEYMAFYDPDPNCKPQYAYKTITRISPSQVQWLYTGKHTKPSPKTPYFWRTGDIFYIVGIEGVPVKHIEVGLYHTIDPVEKINIDEPFDFPQELLPILKRQVTDLARYPFLFKNEQRNDGTEEDQTKNVPKIVSVNDQQSDQ